MSRLGWLVLGAALGIWAYQWWLDGDVAAVDHLLGAQWKDVRP